MNSRLRSLDVFRGATIAAMILVNNPGDWKHVYAPLLHAHWHGCTPTDLIFPFFLFILGVAIPYSQAGRLERTEGARRPLVRQVARRSAVLLALGLFLNWFPIVGIDWPTARVPGVLQRIALVYLCAALIHLYSGTRGAAAAAVLLLASYWALLLWVPVPGVGAGGLEPEGNLAAWVDQLLFGAHTWKAAPGPGDPEGLLSTLPAIATALAGVLTGAWLRRAPVRGRTGLNLVAWGAGGLVVGSLWGLVLPLNKNLWTSSYAVFTAGAALVSLGICFAAVDLWGAGRWTRPFEHFGWNAIGVFVGSGLLARILAGVAWPDAEGVRHSAKEWLVSLLGSLGLPAQQTSLLYAIANVLLWWAVAALLYRRKVFLKV